TGALVNLTSSRSTSVRLDECVERVADCGRRDVEDETKGPDLGSKDERQPTIPCLLVPPQGFDDSRWRRAEAAHRKSCCTQQMLRALGNARLGDAESLGQPRLRHDAERNGLAVAPAAIACRGLERMADGVAVVEDVTELSLLLVALDHRGLDTARTGD